MIIEYGVKIRGKCSEFGGPLDEGVKHDEGLALFNTVDQMPKLFLPEPPPKINNARIQEGPGLAMGLARRLDPEAYYIAMRWRYDLTPKSSLRNSIVRVQNQKNNRYAYAICADWGPNERTERVADLSPGIMKYLELETDDIVECTLIKMEAYA